LCTSLCFGLPDLQFSRFNTIYVDHMVDANDFRTLISDCMDDWKSSLSSVSYPSTPAQFYVEQHLNSLFHCLCESVLTWSPIRRLNVFFYSRSNVLLSSVPAASKLVGFSSILMCGMSAISAITLSLRHDGLAKATAGKAVRSVCASTGVHHG
jgi:hypothetical protein